MNNKYTFAQLEAAGVEAVGIFNGDPVLGWVMNETDFVNYAKDAQQVTQVTQASEVIPAYWTLHGSQDTRLNAVIRFKRRVEFPRFSMDEGSRWGFAVYRKTVDRLKAIEAGERFDFAGGQCLPQDVEILYIGPGDLDYSRAAGYI